MTATKRKTCAECNWWKAGYESDDHEFTSGQCLVHPMTQGRMGGDWACKHNFEPVEVR